MQSEDCDRMTSKNQRLVMVPKSVVEKMWKCQICSMIMSKPMSIPECLHIFCQKCIRGKITKEGLKRCPICNTELGRAALDRLRIDHNMTSIRKKLINPKDQPAEKIEEGKGEEHGLEEEEETRVLPQPTFPLPSKKKERSLSSLAKSPKYSDQNVGRTKSVGTKAGSSSQVPALSIQEPAEKLEKQLERLSLPKAAQKKNKNSSKSSKGKAPIRVPEKCAEPMEVIIGLERQINPPAETASEPTPYNKPTVEGSSSRGAKTRSNEEEIIKSKGKGKLIEETSKLVINIDEEDDEKREVCAPPVPEQPQKTRRGRPKKATVACEDRVNVNKGKAVVDSARGDCEKIMAPIWLTLLASDNQEGRAPLPQIPSCYLRIKDVNLTISYLKKYIMQKLLLESEDEVEISLWGQPLLSSMKLHSLIGLWSQIGPTLERVKTRVGSSGADFVMVLCYGRKSLPY